MAVLLALAPAGLAGATACAECHAMDGLTLERDGKEVSLRVTDAHLAGSPHEGFACTDCHEGLDPDAVPHASPIPPPSCLGCHGEIGASHAFHPALAEPEAANLAEPANRCASCHGSHAIRPASDPAFRWGEGRVTAACGECHGVAAFDVLHSAHAKPGPGGQAVGPDCLDCHGHGRAALPEDPVARAQVEAELCQSCHRDDAAVNERSALGQRFILSFSDSVHGRALASGAEGAPTCIDCHGPHHVGRSSDPGSSVSRSAVAGTCAQCHAEPAQHYLGSVHASAVARGSRDAPVCTDCHGEHDILPTDDPDADVEARNVSARLCGDCHASVKLAEKYDLPANRTATFEDSFHGLALRGGSVEIVNCASCHGWHDVLPSSDPRSLVHPANLAATCGSCHEGANERFGNGKVHVTLDPDSEEPLLFWISTFYLWLIVLVVGGMVGFNGVDFLKKVRMKVAGEAHDVPVGGDPHRLYVRLTVQERLQHGGLVISFVVLAVTGFLLRFPDAVLVQALREVWPGFFEARTLLHRVSAVTMLLTGAWHGAYLAFTPRGRRLFLDLLPRPADLRDAVQVLLFNLGRRATKPRLGRFSYIEKAEYWALVWGTVIMTVTGAMLWLDNHTLGLVGKLGFDAARAVHVYEAVLACLAIIVWHFYFVIFNPDVYPMNLAWLTGHLSRREMAAEHPAELEALDAEEAGKDASTPGAVKPPGA